MFVFVSQELDWVDYFLYEFRDKFLEKEWESIFYYNLVVYYFCKFDYDKVFSLFNQQFVFDDIFYNFNSCLMLLQIYYEKGLFDLFIFYLDSFMIYISWKKQLGYYCDNYINLI